jgi:cytochrome d ubiquinol oxidase subunit II
VSKVDVCAFILWVALTLYAVLAGADFGAGFWDLVSGGAERGAAGRELIDRVLTPVWEANHVWLIFMLVFTWTGFPDAFGPLMSTLFVPLSLAALGIVLRGAGFAFRHITHGVPGQRALGATFAIASVITPFFMGTVAGAVATGRVPADGSGDRLTSWLNITSIGIGVLLVSTCAYIAAVFLHSDARDANEPELVRLFRARALAAGVVAGAVAAIDLVLLHEHAPELYDDLVGDALPLVIVSAICGAGVLVQLVRDGRGTRWLSIGALAAVIFGWGVAQRPDILPGALTLEQAAAAPAALDALLIVTGVAAVVVGPALALLITLQQRSMLGEGEHDPEAGA